MRLRAAPSVASGADMARMKLKPSALSRALRGMAMDQNSTAVAMRVPAGAAAETGTSVAMILPGKRDWPGRLSCA